MHATLKSRLCLALLLVLFFGLIGYRSVHSGWYEPPPSEAKKGWKHRGTDFTAYYSAGELARNGGNIYDFRQSSTPRRPYIYPPTFAVFPMAPLTLFSHNLAIAIFYVLNVLLLLGSLWLLGRMLYAQAPPEASFWRSALLAQILACLACGRFIDSNFKLGQANFWTLFPITLAVYLLWRYRNVLGGSLCGLLVALAVAFKVTPGLFGLYFLWHRRGWAMVGGAIGLVLFLYCLPAVAMGSQATVTALQAFGLHALSKLKGSDAASSIVDESGQTVSVGWRQERSGEKEENSDRAVGISLRGTLMKLFTDLGDAETTWQLAHLEPEQVKFWATVVAVILLILTVILTWPGWIKHDVHTQVLAWGLVAIAMLLISPLTRKAHCVVLLIPVMTLLALLQQGRLKDNARRFAIVGVAGLGALGFFTSGDLIGERMAQLAHSAGAFTWAMLLLFICCAQVLHSLRPEPPTNL